MKTIILTKSEWILKIQNRCILKGECLEWQGCKMKKGYGKIKAFGKYYYTHRLIYELGHDIKLNPKEVIRHSCHNPSCCNLNHLTKGTQLENIQDMMVAGRNTIVSLPGIKNPRAKLTEDNVREIRKIRKTTNTSLKMLAKKFNVSITVIHHVEIGKTWRHVV